MPAVPAVDEAEFERLYRRWRPATVTLCRRLLGPCADAEDAAQEAFLRAWAARDRYSSVLPFWPWLATIARRLCADQRRRAAVELLGDRLTVVDLSPEHVVVAGDEVRVVLEVIDRMRPRERSALVRRELDGWSYARIARVEGVTVDAVRASLKRARASLRNSVFHDDVVDAVPLSPASPVQSGARPTTSR